MQIQSSESANYNGLQLTAQQRMSHGFQVNAFYIWSKTLQSEDLDTSGNTGNSATTEPEDNRLRSLDRQRSAFDQRHVFAASAVWKPRFAVGHHWEDYVVNGWTLTSIIQLQSGNPFNITTGSDDNSDGVNNDRPNLAPGVVRATVKDNGHSRSAMMSQWVDIHQFCRWNNSVTVDTNTPAGTNAPCPQNGAGPLGSDGTLRENELDSPGARAVAASLFKDIHFTERIYLQLRAEATNVFNLTNLPAPTGSNAQVSSGPTFGRITGNIANGTFSNRVLQIGGRILF
jgi:hypothetical protein